MGNTTSTPKHLQRSDKTKSVIFTFEDYTSDAPDDEKISREAGALQLAISDHVRDYYHERQIQRSPEDIEKALLKERERLPLLSSIEISHLLCDVRTRRSALNFFLSHMVLKNISFFGHKSHTLLSPGAVGCINDFGFGDPQVKLTDDEETAFTQWRAVTAHLLPKIQKRPTSYQSARIDRLAKAIDEIIMFFSDPAKDNAERLESLRSVVEKAGIVGEMIFASPSRWKFDWNASRRDLRSRDRRSKEGKTQPDHQVFDKEGKIVVIVLFPALIQMDTKDPEDKHGPRRTRRGDYDGTVAVSEILKEVRKFAELQSPKPQGPEQQHSSPEQQESKPAGSHPSLAVPAGQEPPQSKVLKG
ncbi:hypothetical protein ONS95_010359 [Cadophora gregata]|uniref:uncharacterized protein n=1 Tax=Cadophora gregata TaxID=51156 RepID=UPI0026DCA1EF|nr:uncharacterized protein ONS95_010359 [Cadophora gregata]KAK0122097.1 hypothetical protein ONS95_010359 [Cadophora gregata]